MIDDTLEMDEDSELEDEADEEVEKVLYELTDGKLGQAGAVVDSALPVRPFRFFFWWRCADRRSVFRRHRRHSRRM